MKIKRVLTIESVDNSTSRRMLKTIYGEPQYNKYDIHHCFFLINSQKNIDKNILYDILDKEIEKINPQAVLIHTGNDFYTNKSIFLDVLPLLRKRHPSIMFGIQNRGKFDKKLLDVLDNNKEIIKIEDIIFKIDR